jgi:hypothetical protein
MATPIMATETTAVKTANTLKTLPIMCGKRPAEAETGQMTKRKSSAGLPASPRTGYQKHREKQSQTQSRLPLPIRQSAVDSWVVTVGRTLESQRAVILCLQYRIVHLYLPSTQWDSGT